MAESSIKECKPDYEKMLVDVNKNRQIVNRSIDALKELVLSGIHVSVSRNDTEILAFIGALNVKSWSLTESAINLQAKIDKDKE